MPNKEYIIDIEGPIETKNFGLKQYEVVLTYLKIFSKTKTKKFVFSGFDKEFSKQDLEIAKKQANEKIVELRNQIVQKPTNFQMLKDCISNFVLSKVRIK